MSESQERSTWPPLSDPSPLTTQQILREIASLKEVLDTRLAAMDKAMVLFQDGLTRAPTETQKVITTLRELIESRLDQEDVSRKSLGALIDEKFGGVKVQFDLLDKGTKEKADLTDRALQAALSTAEKAVQRQNDSFSLTANKTEAAFTKLLDQQAETIRTLNDTFNDKINNLKESQTLTQGRATGMSQFFGYIVGLAGLVALIISFFRTH